VPVIIWLNGGFGAGKTTLAEELHRRLPEAVVYDPEEVGLMLWKWLPPNGDFQHLPSWRELVVATALSLRRHHAETLIVPMSLIRDAYRAEILGGLGDAGQEILHVFLEVDAGVLRERLNARVTHPGGDWEQGARKFGMTGVAEMVAAAARQPAGTLMLRSDRLTPAELADEVLTAAGFSEGGRGYGGSLQSGEAVGGHAEVGGAGVVAGCPVEGGELAAGGVEADLESFDFARHTRLRPEPTKRIGARHAGFGSRWEMGLPDLRAGVSRAARARRRCR
jgi:hypothetical protein